jgi:hypothetical protein
MAIGNFDKGKDKDKDKDKDKPPTAAALPKTKKKSHKGAIAGLVILVIIIAIIAWFAWAWNEGIQTTNYAFESGCEPQAFNQYGQPTWWLCPPGIDINKRP